ncbi:MAG: DUF1080 domain-containing protein [Acidobacteriota bacterium]
MYRLGALSVLSVAIACSGQTGEAPESARERTREMLGRWDVTAGNGDEYPLWFELVEEEGRIRGTFQGRFGHAVSMERTEVSDEGLTFRVSSDTYTGSLAEERWEGTARKEDGSTLQWTAVRAPELKPPDDPRWGDSVELFNGTDLSGWVARHPLEPNMWRAEGGVLANRGKGTDLVTEARFGDFKLHIEVNCPEGGNSGIYLRGRYEVQVQDDYGKEASSRRMGGIYGQVDPTQNAAKPAGEWQAFDIVLLGRWVTASLNGKTIIDHQEIPGITGGALDSREGEPGPLMLQGDHGPVSYRNIVLTPVLEGSETEEDRP